VVADVVKKETQERWIDDEICEVRQVVDLTLSSDEEEEDHNDAFAQPALARPTPHPHDGTALLTPIPTTLKSDRLGIGLKAKTYGPHRASQKRVTHNQAALARHVQVGEEMRQRQKAIGRGRRGYARESRKEQEDRRSLLAYMNE
jgi:hypothetical protein